MDQTINHISIERKTSAIREFFRRWTSREAHFLIQKVANEDQIQDQTGPFIRRSRLYSSGAFHDIKLLRTQSDSPCSSSSNVSPKQSSSHPHGKPFFTFLSSSDAREANKVEMILRCYKRCFIENRKSPSKRLSRSKWFQDATKDAAHKIEQLNIAGVNDVSSESSFYCYNKVFVRYISIPGNSNTRT
ncbi:hypothetical protein L1987_27771 [Smallanthus sonchifolius]|uniref:Uncharacterized protein n=1 Tax=Smallanthus sonchifolius TaxID=185202 RepID=A0ACB9IC55_9ASTR|nr:hypothetical protein L1987_27771 [Smallanthus sonchifolius]